MKFSIITPTYNRANTIGRTIESMLRQTYPNFEMIIVDDGSTDDTSNVVEKYSRADSRIRFIRLGKNFGNNKARNVGLQSISSDTDWVGFLDSDDIYLEDALENVKNKIENFPDFKWFAFSTIYENGKLACTIKHDNLIGDYDVVLGKDNLALGEFCVFLHRTLIEQGFRFEESVKNAYEYIAWLRLSKRGVKILYTTIPVRIYYLDSENSLVRARRRDRLYYENSFKGLKMILDEFGIDLKKANRKNYALYKYAFGYTLIKLGRKFEGIQKTIEAFVNDPANLRFIRNMVALISFEELIYKLI